MALKQLKWIGIPLLVLGSVWFSGSTLSAQASGNRNPDHERVTVKKKKHKKKKKITPARRKAIQSVDIFSMSASDEGDRKASAKKYDKEEAKASKAERKQQKKDDKLKKKEKKLLLKAEKAGKKRHLKIQDNKTRKRMKKNQKKTEKEWNSTR